jgi:protein-tyrosine phosphatase
LKISVLYVCLGNICRSPLGEAILKHFVKNAGLQDQIYVDSCGMGSWHIGYPPNPRMQQAASTKGYVMDSRASGFEDGFFNAFDYILAADFRILGELLERKPYGVKSNVMLMTAFSEKYYKQEVPDPYYGGDEGFVHVLDMLEESTHSLFKELQKKLVEDL